MESKNRDSYTAADALPFKLLRDTDLVKRIMDTKIIPPIHVQFVPTNACNMTCDFCSCSKEDRKVEMPLEKALDTIDTLDELGTKAATITGGGEPLVHKHIGEILKYFHANKIQTGLVTNGLKLESSDYDALRTLTWCRISNGDFRTMTPKYQSMLEKVISQVPIDWAFSHVVSPKPNYEEIGRVVNFANKNGMTHVRLVADLFSPDKVDLESVKAYLKDKNIDDSKVVYQNRDHPTKGGDCRICYLKPLIGADGIVYNCCGVQYALNPPSHKMPKELSLGRVEDLKEIFSKPQKPFKGEVCHKCYYMNYNTVLGNLVNEMKHERFL